MGFFKPDPPTPPDPTATAGAQTQTNVNTALANAFLNNMNQVTPTGSLKYDQTSTYTFTDADGKTYNIPRFTVTQSLNPAGQFASDQGQAAQANLAAMANAQSARIGGLLSQPFVPGQGQFDARTYLAANPDVMAAARASGQDPAAFAFQHYNTLGQYEGRAGTSTGGTPLPGTGSMDWLHAIPFAEGNLGDVGQQTGTLRATQGQQQYGFGDAGQLQRTFGDAGNITRSYGAGDFSQDRNKVEEALYGRLSPQLQQDRSRLEQQLADQGIRYGSPAYDDAMRQLNQQQTDARMAVISQAGAEQQRMMDMAAQRAGFENTAQQQAYMQAQGRGTFANMAQAEAFKQAQARGEFYNQAQQQDYLQALQSGQFANAAQQQAFAQAATRNTAYNTAIAQNAERQKTLFNAQNQLRQQSLTEQYQQRNQPLNEISALLSGSQVQTPNWMQTANTQIPTTDIAGLLNNRFTQDMSIFNAQNQNFQQLMGGIFGALGGIGKGVLSDVREKENIKPMGSVYAAGEDGKGPLPIYQYSYKKDASETPHVGPMAQDVEKVDKRAVFHRGGRKYIDSTKLGSILKVA